MISARVLFLFTWLVCFDALASAQQYSFIGKCVGVMDGNTITIMHNKKPERIQLEGIDCPELSQAFGQNSKQCVADLTLDKLVDVYVANVDQSGYSICRVYLPNGKCLNQELIRTGLAWCDPKFSHDKALAELENNARKSQLGLWSQSAPVTPWDFREKAKLELSKQERIISASDQRIKAPVAQVELVHSTVTQTISNRGHSANQPIRHSNTEKFPSLNSVTSSTAENNLDPGETIVYICESSTAFHRAKCTALNTPETITLRMAIQRGLLRCAICQPPDLPPKKSLVEPKLILPAPTPDPITYSNPDSGTYGSSSDSHYTGSGGKRSAGDYTTHVGPRGGIYHYSKNGNKVYHKRK